MLHKTLENPPERQTVLVTGASGGIGRAIALRMAQDGFGVAVHYHRNEAAAQQVATAIAAQRGHVRLLTFDVSDRAQTRAALEKDVASYGAYYGVVCNAGITADNTFAALSEAQWDSVLHTNLDAFYNVLRPLVMPMVRRRAPGRIITMASVSGIVGNRGQTNYSAAKAGVIGATRALAMELAGRNITVNCVAPGMIETDMVPDGAVREEALKLIPAKRLGKPEEVADLVGFLMSAQAAYITRQVISVNGGMT